jgi:hypothetical protein
MGLSDRLNVREKGLMIDNETSPGDIVCQNEGNAGAGRNSTKMRTNVPVGIFILLFLMQSAVSFFVCSLYLLTYGKSWSDEIQSYTRNYSIALAEALAQVSEMAYAKKDYDSVTGLFRQRIKSKSADEAFFVLLNGKIIAHTSDEKRDALSGNIARDEFRYNSDLILKNARLGSSDVMFSDYNIPGINNPFIGRIRVFVKDHFYAGVDSNAWLAAKAVFHKKKAVGAVGIIVGKERVFNYIALLAGRTLRFFYLSIATAFAVSLFISIVVFIRYRRIRKKAIDYASAWGDGVIHDVSDIAIPVGLPAHSISSQSDFRAMEVRSIQSSEYDSEITIELSGARTPGQVHGFGSTSPAVPTGSDAARQRTVKDAVPVRRGN